MTRTLKQRAGTIVGLDLSLTGAAAVVLPKQPATDTWKGHRWRWWSPDDKLYTLRCGYALPKDADAWELVTRLRRIVDELLGFMRKHEPAYVFVENYAFSKSSSSVTKLAELGGAFRYALHQEHGIAAVDMVASRARVYLLGKLPKGVGSQKPACRDALLRARFVFGSMDECDAFVIANAGLGELGGAGVTFAGG